MADKITKKNSDVWVYFKEPVKKKDKLDTTCTLCKMDIAYHSGTSNMRNHLNRKHPAKSSGQIGALVGRQTTLTSSWIRGPMSSQAYEKNQEIWH